MTAGAIALFLTVSAKVLSFGRDVVLSTVFGANAATDAFFIANTIPGVVWAGVIVTINAVFLPLYIARRVESRAGAAEFATEAVQIYFVLGLLVALGCMLGAETIVKMTAPGAPPSTLAEARVLTVIMAFGFVFSGYVAVQNAVQQANGFYRAPLMVPVLNNLIAIVGVVIAGGFGDIRIAVIAAVGAWVVQSPIQRWQTRTFYRSSRRLLISRKLLQRLTLLSLPVMLGTFLDQINIYVGIYLAGGLGEGAISHLNYASRLAMFLASAFSTLVSYFLFPRLAGDAAAGEDSRTARTIALGVLTVAFATAPLMVLSFQLRHDVVAIVYGHGALLPAGLAATASAFAYFSAGIVFIAVREVFNRMFFSYNRMTTPLAIGVVATLANLGSTILLVRSMGTSGIALGASIGAAVYTIGQLLVIAVWKPRLLDARLATGTVAIAVAILPAWLACAVALPHLAGFAPLPRLFVATLLFGVVFLIAAAPLAWFGGYAPLLRNLFGHDPQVAGDAGRTGG